MSLPRKFSDIRDIPSRRILINDASQLPNDYSTTPGGTLFSTTPGGTRIIYDRNALLQMRNSPVAKTPPKNLPNVPGITSFPPLGKQKENGNVQAPEVGSGEGKTTDTNVDEPQFEMDI